MLDFPENIELLPIVQSGWKASDFPPSEPERWLHVLSEQEIDLLGKLADKCLSITPAATIDDLILSLDAIEIVYEDDLRCSEFDKVLNHIVQTKVVHGQGFVVYRGLPVHLWSKAKTATAFLLLSRTIGPLRKQNKKAHVLGHVINLGLSSSNPNVRVYQTSERQTFHTDAADVVLLLCLQSALEGGVSSLVSTDALYNELLRRSPDLLRILLNPLPYDRRGEQGPGELPYLNVSVLSVSDDEHATAFYQRQYIDSTQRLPEAPRLSELSVRALNTFDEICNSKEMQFSTVLQPGDVQIVHNYSTLHDRSAFVDDPVSKRHLLRAWVSPSYGIELPKTHLFSLHGVAKVGNRGGLPVPGVDPVAVYEVRKIEEEVRSDEAYAADLKWGLAT